MKKKWTRSGFLGRFAAAALLAAGLAACSGDDGQNGTPGKDADPAVTDNLQQQIDAIVKAANPETCVTCHTGSDPVARSGPAHQARYAQFYQDGVVVVKTGTMNLVAVGGNTTRLTFQMTKNGANFDCTKSTAFAIGSYWSQYDFVVQDLFFLPVPEAERFRHQLEFVDQRLHFRRRRIPAPGTWPAWLPSPATRVQSSRSTARTRFSKRTPRSASPAASTRSPVC